MERLKEQIKHPENHQSISLNTIAYNHLFWFYKVQCITHSNLIFMLCLLMQHLSIYILKINSCLVKYMLYLRGISSSLVGYAEIHTRNSLKIKLYQMNDSNTLRRGFSAVFKELFQCLTELTNPQHLVLVWFLI